MKRTAGEVRSANTVATIQAPPKREISFSTAPKGKRNPNPVYNRQPLPLPPTHTQTSALALALKARNEAFAQVNEAGAAGDGPLKELKLALFKLAYDGILPQSCLYLIRIANDFNDLLDVLENCPLPAGRTSRLRETSIDLCYKLIDHKERGFVDDEQKEDILNALWNSTEYKVILPKVVEVDISDSIDRQITHPSAYIEKQQHPRRLRKSYSNANFPFLPKNEPIVDLQTASYQLVEDGILKPTARPEIDSAEEIDDILDVLEYHVEKLPINFRPNIDGVRVAGDDDDEDESDEEEGDGGKGQGGKAGGAGEEGDPFADATDRSGGGGGGGGKGGSGGLKLPAESPLYNITSDCANDLIDLKSAKRYATAYQRKNVQRSLAAGMGLDPDNVVNHDLDVEYERAIRVDFASFVPGQDHFL